MQTLEYRTVDKSTWGDGPWQSEPDKKQWQDEATGLPCLIVRSPSGALCGYVGVPKGHPNHGIDYDDVEVEVHGGLTFAAPCAHSKDEQQDVSRTICHLPSAGEPDDVWWLGFDCAHAGDESPAINSRLPAHLHMSFEGDTYKDLAYVTAQVQSLAKQLHEAR